MNRDKIIHYLIGHPKVLDTGWRVLHVTLSICTILIPKKKTIVITSYAGRNYDDSPKALYEEICKRKEFDNWEIVWVFVNPERFIIPRGRKIKIDTLKFFYTLMSSKLWISNTGMDRDIHINQPKTVKIETWHGTPLKKIGIDQNNTAVGRRNRRLDNSTIRCAQSEYDREIFKRVFNAAEDSFLMCDLPRNDGLRFFSADKTKQIRSRLGIPEDKKVLLYMPTYREYDIDDRNQYYAAPPIDLQKWEAMLGAEYVLLVRLHYAVSKAMEIKDNDFVKDVSHYATLNDLYLSADCLISDYSSAFVDYSILERPMLCFAYDYEKYSRERGLYIDFNKEMPCKVLKTEDEVIECIKTMDYEDMQRKVTAFREKYAPYKGVSSSAVVDEAIRRLEIL